MWFHQKEKLSPTLLIDQANMHRARRTLTIKASKSAQHQPTIGLSIDAMNESIEALTKTGVN